MKEVFSFISLLIRDKLEQPVLKFKLHILMDVIVHSFWRDMFSFYLM